MEKHTPCLDKHCGQCCDPVKINTKSQGELPKDKNGHELFMARNEILAPESRIDTDRVKTFDCKNFDPITKRCLDHENRPEMCRSATCISNPDGDIDEQHKKVVAENFIKIFPR